jgi:cytolysin-activating lysine-acyltransferase
MSDKDTNAAAGAAGGTEGAGGKAGAGPMTVSGTLGEIVWLLTQSPGHRYLFVADLEWLVMTPMLLGQFRTFRSQDRVVGLALWAYLSPEVEARLEAGVPRLSPADWKSGDRPWLVELVAPFGGTDAMVEELRRTVFRGKTFKMHAHGPDGKRETRTVG